MDSGGGGGGGGNVTIRKASQEEKNCAISASECGEKFPLTIVHSFWPKSANFDSGRK